VVKLRKHFKKKKRPYKIKFISDPICWTEVPENLRMLGRQRRRWHLGLMQSIIQHRSVLFNPAYGKLGLIVMPYYLLVEMLSPFVEVFGYIVVVMSFFLHIISAEFFLLFLILAVFYGIFLSTAGVFLEELTYKRYPKWGHLAKLLLFGIFENFGYRQLNSFWRVQAAANYFMGKRQWEYVMRSKNH
jgi:cellulose synthase/poly-beta-1,6-N-acetylglucosamine synthase-like glycosyltransferase